MNINAKLLEVKKRIKKITKHFPYTEENINYLTIVYMAFIMLDESISDFIDEVLNETYCLFTSLSLEEAYKKYIADESIGSKCKESCAVFEGHYYDNGRLVYYPFIIISQEQAGQKLKLVDIFDSLIHELKHAINEVIIKCNENGFYSGLSYVCKDNKALYSDFDEAFNSYLTKIYLDNITYLKESNIEDIGIRSILNSFQVPETYEYSYDSIVKQSLPLYKVKKIFWIFYNASLYKNRKDLRHHIEEAFDFQISFKKFMKYYYDSENYSLKDILDLINSNELEEKVVLPNR